MAERVACAYAGGSRASEWTVTVTQAGAERPDDSLLAGCDDLALVRACLEGRREAFDLIVERHQRSIYQLCHRFCRTHEDAADAAQEVFLRAYRSLASFKGQASVRTWLYRIGVNVSLNRAAARRPPADPLDAHENLHDGTPDAAGELMRAEQAARVRAAIARLPDKQRTVLVLRVYQELTHEEIAAIVGTSVGAVKANVFHAVRKLRTMLADERGDYGGRSRGQR